MAIWAVMVQTGSETEAAGRLRAREIACSVPTRELPERRGGAWRNVRRVMVPGYIFARAPEADGETETYYTIMGTPGVLRVLGALAPADAEWLKELDNGGACWGVSRARMTRKGYEIYEGPLVGREAHILKLDAHRQRASVALRVGDQRIAIGLGLIFADNLRR